MGHTLRVGLLGSLTVDAGDGALVGLPSATQRRLLSVLALDVGRVVSADRLCRLLECSPGSLRTSVSRLRATVGSEHLVTDPPGYVLTALTDVAEFEALVATGRAAAGATSIAELDRALALWRGEAVDEFGDEPWAIAEVERLDELRAAAIEARAEAMLATGRAELAIAEMSSHAVRHPLREKPRSILMRALAQEGRTTEALRAYQDLRDHLAERTGTEPSEALRSLEQSIATSGVSGPRRSPHTNLPAPRTSLVGREDLVPRVRDLIDEHRLVSLIGPGGVGKTRLAIEAAGQSLDAFPGGVVFVDLTGATAAAEVSGVLVRASNAPVRALQSDEDAISELLRDRTALLVIDNCEHVIDRAAEVIDEVLLTAPGVRVLATSREPLKLHGERRLIVPSLDVDGPASAAARLFADRSRALDEGIGDTPPATDLATVAEIARRLDGIPLAIELAAAQTATLTTEEILALLDDRFSLLTGDERRVPPRQQTLAATVGWSYDLLDPDQQRAFRWLSTCAGAFSLATAARVLGCALPHANRLVEDLRAKSLLVAVHEGGARRAYRFLETLRELGRAEAAAAGEAETARRAVEEALLPSSEVRGSWTSLVNGCICAEDPSTMLEDATRLAAAAGAEEGGRLDHAAFLYASVAFRDDVGTLRARAAIVGRLAARRSELDPLAWRAANAAKLLVERAGRDYGAVLGTAAAMAAALDEDDPARSWFEVWGCALTTAVDPEGGLTATTAALPAARDAACAPLDWTLSQFLGTKATGLALLQQLDEAHDVAAEAACWAPIGQESRDQMLALLAWFAYLRGTPVDPALVADITAQDHDLGLAELCAAPGALCSGGTIEERAARLIAVAGRRPKLDVPTPHLLAFAWLAIEQGDRERARRLVAGAELYDASTEVALVHLLARVDDWPAESWAAGLDAVAGLYLSPEHEKDVERGAVDLEAEVDRWERLLADRGGGQVLG